MKRAKIEAWLGAAAPGESLVAAMVGGPVNGGAMDGSDQPGAAHLADLHVQVEHLGYDPARRISPFGNLAAVLTDRQLLLVSVGGMWGARPKDLLVAAPRGGFRCQWWINDVSEAPAAIYANVVLTFADGSWGALGCATKLLGKTVAAAADSEQFIAALGPDAVTLDWRGTTP